MSCAPVDEPRFLSAERRADRQADCWIDLRADFPSTEVDRHLDRQVRDGCRLGDVLEVHNLKKNK